MPTLQGWLGFLSVEDGVEVEVAAAAWHWAGDVVGEEAAAAGGCRDSGRQKGWRTGPPGWAAEAGKQQHSSPGGCMGLRMGCVQEAGPSGCERAAAAEGGDSGRLRVGASILGALRRGEGLLQRRFRARSTGPRGCCSGRPTPVKQFQLQGMRGLAGSGQRLVDYRSGARGKMGS